MTKFFRILRPSWSSFVCVGGMEQLTFTFLLIHWVAIPLTSAGLWGGATQHTQAKYFLGSYLHLHLLLRRDRTRRGEGKLYPFPKNSGILNLLLKG